MGKNKQRSLIRELRKAKADLASLDQYLSDCEDILQEYQQEWSLDLDFILKKFKVEKNSKTSENEENNSPNTKVELFSDSYQEIEKKQEIEKNQSPDWVKKIFRKIALATHPDKTSVETLNNIYRDAASMVENEDYQGLVKICDNLGIDYDIDPELELKMNMEKQQSIRERLKEIDSSIPWIWGESAGAIDFRINFLKSILGSFGVKDFEDSDITSLVNEIESA